MRVLQKIKDDQFWKEMEDQRFGIMALSITAQSCIGSIAVGYLLQLNSDLNIIPLCIVTAVNMTANSLTIAQTSMKSIFLFCGMTFFVSILAIMYTYILK